jgi:hypothetical protein
MSVTGSIAGNLHQGARSEYLAQYFFTAFGTSVVTPRPEDYGVDLFCTTGRHISNRLLITHYYLVQVKSTLEEVEYQSRDSVRWLTSQNYPLFICVVDKKREQIQLFSTIKLFQIFDSSEIENITMLLSNSVEKVQEQATTKSLDLYPPILSVSIGDIAIPEKLGRLKSIIEYWVELANVNIDWRNIGISLSLSHKKYSSNVLPEEYPSLDGNFKGHLSTEKSPRYIDTFLIFLANEINLAASRVDKQRFEALCDIAGSIVGSNEVHATYGLLYLQLAFNAGSQRVNSNRQIRIKIDGREIGVVGFKVEKETT